MNSFALYILLDNLPFLNAEVQMRSQCLCVCGHVCIQKAHKLSQTHTSTSFIHISCFPPSLHREPPFPGVHFFFITRGIGKEMGTTLPFSQWWVHAFEEELCRPGISTPCMHPLWSPRRPLHHLNQIKRQRELEWEQASWRKKARK